MAQTGGYPGEADINSELAAAGIETVTDNLCNYNLEFKQMLWALLNHADWAGAIGVWCPSSATFNVRGGRYTWKGTVKTYTPGSAVNPTDNDTTYIWLNGDNTISSAIDGTGWPATDHVKLAEIDVDSDGVITAVRDLRGQAFLGYTGQNLMASNVICANNQVVCKDNEVLIKT